MAKLMKNSQVIKFTAVESAPIRSLIKVTNFPVIMLYSQTESLEKELEFY